VENGTKVLKSEENASLYMDTTSCFPVFRMPMLGLPPATALCSAIALCDSPQLRMGRGLAADAQAGSNLRVIGA